MRLTPQQIAIATSRAVTTKQSHADIARDLGCHRTTITRNLNRPDIKSRIERAAERIVDTGLDDAIETITRCASLGTYTRDKDLLKIGLDASKHITGMVGINGTTPSTVINALIQVNENVVPPIIAELLQAIAGRDCQTLDGMGDEDGEGNGENEGEGTSENRGEDEKVIDI